jgi:hypothetical protein
MVTFAKFDGGGGAATTVALVQAAELDLLLYASPPATCGLRSAAKIQSTTDAGWLNTFGRNEIEVAHISSALLRIACLVILYKTCRACNRTGNTANPRLGFGAFFLLPFLF